jgi:hypothetical protein
MPFYEICGFILSIMTIVTYFYFLIFHNFKNNFKNISIYLLIYLLLCQTLATAVFIVGILKLIFKIII